MAMKLATAMGELLDVLERETLTRTPDHSLCAKVIEHGDVDIVDYGTEECGGFVWLRLLTAVPSETFPNATTRLCAYTKAYTVRMGVMRPSPQPEVFLNNFEAVTPEDHFITSSIAYEDMDAMEAANLWASKNFEDCTMGSYTPLGPLGDVVGGTWDFTFGLD